MDTVCLQNCPTDTHPNATNLRRQRVRMYFYPRQVPLPGCQNVLLYRMESYLIVNRTNASDGGEYVFNITSRYSTGSESVDRNVTTVIGEFAPLYASSHHRSEARRGGKECRARGSP